MISSLRLIKVPIFKRWVTVLFSVHPKMTSINILALGNMGVQVVGPTLGTVEASPDSIYLEYFLTVNFIISNTAMLSVVAMKILFLN